MHYNLGIILRDLGKLQDAETSQQKAIELNPDLGAAYYALSLLKYSDKNKIWQDQLFTESIFKKQLTKKKLLLTLQEQIFFIESQF